VIPAGILNAGDGGWAFASLARELSAALGIPTVTEPAMFNYVLMWEGDMATIRERSFIPPQAIETASDKRLVAKAFKHAGVPSPQTHLIDFGDIDSFLSLNTGRWVLKYPIGCGGAGHRFIASIADIPKNWPMPCVVQEFISMDEPKVYRIYCVNGHLFGFNLRLFPMGTKCSPWVAHARGARYVHGAIAPAEAMRVAARALQATGLFSSFGCVDLLQQRDGGWLALEVGTDGIYNFVDRNFDSPSLRSEMLQRLKIAFWNGLEKQ